MDTLTRNMNDRYASIVFPNTVIKGLGIVVGCPGNAVVFLMYTFFIKDKENTRYFIPFLAMVDAFGTLFQGTFYILADKYAFIFPSDEACQFLYFVFTSLSGISAHCLLAMALQRFLFICRPLGRQMTVNGKRLSLLLISIASCLYAFPLIFYSGVKTENISFRGQNFTAFVCRIVVQVSSSSRIYVTFLFLMTLINVIATSICYVPVCKTIYQATKWMKTNSEQESFSLEQRKQGDANSERLIREENGESRADDKFDDAKKAVKSKQKRGVASVRISAMFLIVIIVYIFSYVPSFIVILINHSLSDFDPLQMSDAEINAWRFFNTAFIFNHVSNPFIYWYYDKKFRKAVDKLICGIKQRPAV